MVCQFGTFNINTSLVVLGKLNCPDLYFCMACYTSCFKLENFSGAAHARQKRVWLTYNLASARLQTMTPYS